MQKQNPFRKIQRNFSLISTTSEKKNSELKLYSQLKINLPRSQNDVLSEMLSEVLSFLEYKVKKSIAVVIQLYDWTTIH